MFGIQVAGCFYQGGLAESTIGIAYHHVLNVGCTIVTTIRVRVFAFIGVYLSEGIERRGNTRNISCCLSRLCRTTRKLFGLLQIPAQPVEVRQFTLDFGGWVSIAGIRVAKG